MSQTELKIKGMTCASCARGVEKYLQRSGASDIVVDFVTAKAKFTSESPQQTESLIAGIEDLGYKVAAPDKAHQHHDDHHHGHHHHHGVSDLQIKFGIALIFTAPLIASMWLPYPLLHAPWVQCILSLPILFVSLIHFGKSALTSLKAGAANMDVLIIIGVLAAFFYSLAGTILGLGHDYLFYETVGSITTFVLLGNLLEEWSVKKTTAAVEELHKIRPVYATRVSPDGALTKVKAEEIQKEDVLRVNTGDQIPVDGVILEGAGSIDESMISGESVPEEKNAGDQVIGGTLLTLGTITMRATEIGEGTVLSKIIKLVEEGQTRKPKIQRLGDRISAIFVPTVGALALLTFLGYWITGSVSVGDALLRSIAVLVVACPCAMGLATPTAVMVGMGKAAKEGILFKGGDVIESFANVNRFLFDKTGTLTTGSFELQNLTAYGMDEGEVKEILASLSAHSSHPISKALYRIFADAPSRTLTAVTENVGKGVEAMLDSRKVEMGGALLAEAHGYKGTSHQLYLFVDGIVKAGIDLRDEPRSEAYALISGLKEEKSSLGIISGDTRERTEKIAQKLGIDEVHAPIPPVGKRDLIERSSKEQPTAFFGDGVNDAPALTSATVGVSLSGGTHAALASASIVLMKSNLVGVLKARDIARLTLRTIKQNLFWAFCYNIVAIPIAMAGYLTPLVAALAMSFSDVIIIGNSIRLKFLKIKGA